MYFVDENDGRDTEIRVNWANIQGDYWVFRVADVFVFQ